MILSVVAAVGTYYLYSHQLGAISFFLLSFFLFYLSYRQFKKLKETPKQTDDSLK